MIAALFVQTGGVYFGLPDVDPWDEPRDARKYAGPWPVVAHPPCGSWGKLAHIHKHKPGHGLGNDGGCFESALASVRRWGGVLEHPEGSAAWRAFGLLRPTGYAWTSAGDFAGGWVCRVEQGHYGHRARKPTYLYACGVTLPTLSWGKAQSATRVELMDSKSGERAATPPPFRDLLLSIARTAQRRAA